MYSSKPHFVYGFHGTDKKVAFEILNKIKDFTPSNNSYDWLGFGVYFWENDVQRALGYAKESMNRFASKIENPFALGAVIDLGNCLDLLNQKHLKTLSIGYKEMKKEFKSKKKKIPCNTGFGKKDFDFRKRELDSAVIRYTIDMLRAKGIAIDTVRAAFWEGEELYPSAGFREKSHIQIAVINQDCIKGVFLPREKRKKMEPKMGVGPTTY